MLGCCVQEIRLRWTCHDPTRPAEEFGASLSLFPTYGSSSDSTKAGQDLHNKEHNADHKPRLPILKGLPAPAKEPVVIARDTNGSAGEAEFDERDEQRIAWVECRTGPGEVVHAEVDGGENETGDGKRRTWKPQP